MGSITVKSLLRLLAVFPILLASASWSSARAADTQTTLCSDQETVVFSCALSDRKLVSLCASRNLSRDSGYLQYRFGQDISGIELEYPSRSTRASVAFKYLHHYFAKGGTSAVSFRIGTFRYSLFRTTSAFGFNGAGVIVDKADKRIAYLRCEDSTILMDHDSFYHLSAVGLPDANGDVSYIGAEQP